MISARLIKTLEKKGFFLEFPDYSNEEAIIEILKQDNLRLKYSLPLILDNFDYNNILNKLSNNQKKEFNNIIAISDKIYKKEDIKSNLHEIIQKNKIKSIFSKEEFENYYSTFKEARTQEDKNSQKIIEKQAKLRLNLNLNKSLGILFSPAKIRIMEKIFNHEKLTNTELKYYYKSISNINKAILNPALQDYLRIIEITKKFIE